MTSRELAKQIIAEIKVKRYLQNEKLPSENQFVIKYNVSRTLVSKAFELLKSVGAIYSIPKKGHFIAEFFSSLVQSVPFAVGATSWQDLIVSRSVPNFIIAKTNILATGSISCLKRTYFQKKQKVAVTYNWFNPQNLKIKAGEPIIDTLIAMKVLKSSVSNYSFEPEYEFGNGLHLVNYQINYSQQGVEHAAKIMVAPRFFKLTKQEIVL